MKFSIALCGIFCMVPLFSQNVKTPQAKAAIEAKKSGKKTEKVAPPVVYNEDFEKGEELFSLNEPKAAIPYFEKALEAENVNPAIYIYLGVAYYQTEDYNKSLAVCVKGLAREDTDHKVLAYNAGNSCYAMGNYMRADASYAIAIKEDDKYAPAVLNRANAQLKMDHLEDAKNNYIRYLELDPETPQRERIELLLRLLEKEIELRAKQRPELINPDLFVENENMETGDVPELVTLEVPVIVEEKPDEPEKVIFDSIAPAIPEEQLEIAKADEVLADENAPELPVDEEEKVESIPSERVRETAPVIAEAVKAEVEKAPVEKVTAGAPELPLEKTDDEAVQAPAERFAMDELPLIDDKIEDEKAPLEKFSAESAPEIPNSMYGSSDSSGDGNGEGGSGDGQNGDGSGKNGSDGKYGPAPDDLYDVKEIEDVPVVATEVTVVEKSDGTIDIKIPNLSFKVNSAVLTSDASNQTTLKQVYDILASKEYGDCNIIITGYVNPDHDVWTKAEKELALHRAESVKNELIKKGIDSSRIGAEHGDGKTTNKEYNRRVDFKLYRGKSAAIDAK